MSCINRFKVDTDGIGTGVAKFLRQREISARGSRGSLRLWPSKKLTMTPFLVFDGGMLL
jgi:hypothetical protein